MHSILNIFRLAEKKYDAWKVFRLEWCLFERLQVQLLGVFLLGTSLCTIALGRGRSMDPELKVGGKLEEEHEL